MSFLSSLFRRRLPTKWVGRLGFFQRAANIWNCLACHLIIDDAMGTIRWSFGIPGVVSWIVQTPTLPFRPIASWLAGGIGDRAEYGFWHDYYETKLQWRRVIDRAGIGAEWRVIHHHPDAMVVRHETLISDKVMAHGQMWAKKNGFERWSLSVATWHASGCRWYIPKLFDHYFTLNVTTKTGLAEAETIRLPVTPHLDLIDVFDQLALKIHTS